MRLISVGVIVALFTFGRTQNPNCDFTQNVRPFMTYFVYSPGYPRNYSAGEQCRWIAICPSGYNCRLECPDINLPQSPGCSMDRLLISRTGDPQLSSAEYYCGRGTLSITSDGQRLSVGLISSKQSPGGRFYCKLTAQPATVTPAPCRCGYKKTNRIVGGQETGVNEFPMMAGIVYVDQAKIRCGGVIISRRHVMSAAHCVINKKTSDLAVVVGEHNVNEGDSPATQGFRVTNIQTHPLYTTSNNDNDVSILTLHQDIVFSERVGPVCLPFKFANSDFAGSKVTVLGWGTLFPGGPTSATLQKVDVDVISQASCRRQVPSVTNRQMCTYTPGKDSCQDDSGGPLLYTDPSNGLLYSVGIVSYGISCASRSPAINARVTAFLDWIVVTTKEDFCKVSNNDNDVSILTLHQDIVFSERVGPVCLPFKFANSDFAGSKVTVLGWGTLFPGGPTSATLQKVDVDVVSQASCRRQVPSVTNRQMCTYTPGKDSCQDDSGGPLLYTDPSNGLLYSVGIVSYGISCASKSPAINARVTAFLDWIVVTTKEDFCKV